jgi:hypothetical protein
MDVFLKWWVSGLSACPERMMSASGSPGGNPMVKQLSLRVASAAGLFALALFLLGIAPFLSVDAGLTGMAPAVSVDRSLKGDRLPRSDPAISGMPDWQAEFDIQPRIQPRAQIPLGCDPVFSTIQAPAVANVYRRCLT